MKRIIITNYIFAFISIALLLALSPPESMAAPGDTLCVEADTSCVDWGPWQSSFKDVELPNFPGCTLTVYYGWRQCLDPGHHTTQWFIDSTHIPPSDSGCFDFNVWFTNDSLGPTSFEISELKVMLVKEISLIDFKAWYNSAPQLIKDKLRCGTGYHVKTTFFQKICNKVCYSTIDTAGVLEYSLVDVPCMEYNDCCSVTYQYCVTDSNTVRITTIASGHTAVCYASPFPDPSGCPENTVDQEIIPCHDNCIIEEEPYEVPL